MVIEVTLALIVAIALLFARNFVLMFALTNCIDIAVRTRTVVLGGRVVFVFVRANRADRALPRSIMRGHEASRGRACLRVQIVALLPSLCNAFLVDLFYFLIGVLSPKASPVECHY